MKYCLEFEPPQEVMGDGYAFALQNLPARIHRLRQVAIQHSKQYRGFRVASEFSATKSGQDPNYFDAAVDYPVKGGPKRCAEKGALMHVINAGYDKVQMILVAGDVQPDGKTGLALPTLPPCTELCQPMLKAAGQIEPQTLVITVGLEEHQVGVQYFGDLTDKFEGNTLLLDDHFTDIDFRRLEGAFDAYKAQGLIEPSAAVAHMALTGQL